MSREAIYLGVSPPDALATCDVHAWPTENLAARLVSSMRLLHGRGGVNVCVDCIHRAHGDARARVARRGAP